MMFSFQRLVSVSLLGLSTALPWPQNPVPLPPSQDPWYSAPRGFESSPPGSVLRIRPAPGNLTSIVQGSSSAWNILYRTTNSRYEPTFAVTTLFVPAKPDPTALLSYQIAYDTADVDTSPSYTLYTSPPSDVKAAFEPILAEGWFLNMPDYEGPLASFTAGVMSGHAVIDSFRAVRSLYKKFNLNANALYALWGYSGGALASEWAAELQGQYAPELSFAGAALGGLTPNVTSVLLTINGQLGAGLAPSSILGLSSQFPDLRAKIESKLTPTGPYNATTFLSALHMSVDQAGVAFAYQNLSKYFVDGFEDLLNPTIEKMIYSDGLMGYHGVPQMPLFVYKAINDEISPIADTDSLVEKYCGVGANILYQRNTVGGHSADATNGGPAAFAWLASLFTGKYNTTYPTVGCTIQDVTVDITSSPE